MCNYLLRYGYQFLRRCRGSHELWRHPLGGTMLVTRSGLGDTRARQNWLRDLRVKAFPTNTYSG
jgi:predicted RNA binding protein YcfA (HicA-like mRNA interferase family)